MKVVLLDNVRGIGRVGDVKEVSDGYARNFLLPNRKAKPATEGIIKEVLATRAQKIQVASMARQQLQELAATLSGTRVELSGKANQKGTLFAAIPEVTIDGRIFRLPEPLKTVGNHSVRLELAGDITADIIVVVSATK